jgi:hypothetical protein
MDQNSELFIEIDASKLRNAVAVAEAGRGGEVRYLGEIDTTEAATRKLTAKLAAQYSKLMCCYEARLAGYGLYRLIKNLGHDCVVVAPLLIPKKASKHVKTNRRDALELARLLRADELTSVWARALKGPHLLQGWSTTPPRADRSRKGCERLIIVQWWGRSNGRGPSGRLCGRTWRAISRIDARTQTEATPDK